MTILNEEEQKAYDELHAAVGEWEGEQYLETPKSNSKFNLRYSAVNCIFGFLFTTLGTLGLACIIGLLFAGTPWLFGYDYQSVLNWQIVGSITHSYAFMRMLIWVIVIGTIISGFFKELGTDDWY